MKACLKYAALSIIAAGSLSISQTSFAQVPRHSGHVEGGIVTSMAPDHATIKTIANEPFTVVFEPNTSFWKQVGTLAKTVPAKLTDIEVGKTINVFGPLDPDGITKHAKMVMILTPETSRNALASAGGVGLTTVNGRVAAIDGRKWTITRLEDQVTQMIEVSEDASFFRGTPQAVVPVLSGMPNAASHSGVENITFADIKVGDTVYTGGALKFPRTVALKDNMFVAKKVAIMIANTNAPGAAPKQ